VRRNRLTRESFDQATERPGESARSKTGNAASINAVFFNAECAKERRGRFKSGGNAVPVIAVLVHHGRYEEILIQGEARFLKKRQKLSHAEPQGSQGNATRL
jgi:hypothetical protein